MSILDAILVSAKIILVLSLVPPFGNTAVSYVIDATFPNPQMKYVFIRKVITEHS